MKTADPQPEESRQRLMDLLLTRAIIERAEAVKLEDATFASRDFDLLDFRNSIFSMSIRGRLAIAILIVCSRKVEYYNLVFDIIESISLLEEHQCVSKNLQLTVLQFFIVYKIFEIYNLGDYNSVSLSEIDFNTKKSELRERILDEILNSTRQCSCRKVNELKQSFIQYISKVHENCSNYADILLTLDSLSSIYEVQILEKFISNFLQFYHPILEEFKVLLDDFIDVEELRKIVVDSFMYIGEDWTRNDEVIRPPSPEGLKNHTGEEIVTDATVLPSTSSSNVITEQNEGVSMALATRNFPQQARQLVIQGVDRIAKIIFSIDEENI